MLEILWVIPLADYCFFCHEKEWDQYVRGISSVGESLEKELYLFMDLVLVRA